MREIDLTAPKLVTLAAIVVTVGTVPAIGTNAAATDDANVIGEHLEKALDGQAPYDGEPYVTDGTATVLFAGPDPPDPAVEPTAREGWMAHFEAHHEPFKLYATELLDEHGADVTRTVASANTVTAEVPLDRVEEIVDADRDRLAMLETAALDWHGAVELQNTESVPPTKVAAFHDEGFAGDGVMIADIDTGVDDEHVCMRDADDESRVVKWKDYVNSRADPYDDNGHGTHTTGTAAGSPASTGCKEPGMAPKADIMGVKILDSWGSGSWSDAQAALEWAFQNGADVSTNSWGGSCSGGGADTRDQVNELGKAGFDQVFAAGNDGPGDSTVGCPGTARYAVTVGATDHDKNIASFSSRGPCNDGTGLRTCPDVVAIGVDVVSAVPGGGYEAKSGTSMATPHVAGGVAVAEDALKELAGRDLIEPEGHAEYAPTYSEAEHLMKNCAQDLGESGPDNDYGWGFIQLDCVFDKVLDRSRPVIEAQATVGDASLTCSEADQAAVHLENVGGQPASGTAELTVTGPEDASTSEQVSLARDETASLSLPIDASMAPGDYHVNATYDYTWENPLTGETQSGSASDEAGFRVVKAVLEPAHPLPAEVGAGSTFETGLTLANTGNAPATDLQVVERIPPAYDLVPQIPVGQFGTIWSDPAPSDKRTTLDGTTMTYNVAEVPAGATWQVAYELLAELPGEHAITSDVGYSDHGACEDGLSLSTPQTVSVLG